MEKHPWRRVLRVPHSLYRLTLISLVRQKNLDVCSLKTLPGHIKEDLLQLGLLRRKGKNTIGEFLHPDITRLDTFQCNISSDDLEKISRCRRLRLLVINPPKYYRFNHTIFSLNKLFYNMPFLVKLHITHNEGVTDDVIAGIMKHCRLVQELDVSGSFNLTDAAGKYLAEMNHLRALDLSDTPIGDCGIEALSNGPNAKLLIHLRLNHCKNITDVGIFALINGCENLLKLVVCGWPRVSIECQLALNSFLNRHGKEKNTWMELF